MNTNLFLKNSIKPFFQNIENEEEALLTLRKATIAGVVSKGIKETLKALEANRCKQVYLNMEAEDDQYKKCVKDYCELYKVNLIEIQSKYKLRDAVMVGIPSEILINEAKIKGKTPKVMPNCNVAAILEFGDVNAKLGGEM